LTIGAGLRTYQLGVSYDDVGGSYCTFTVTVRDNMTVTRGQQVRVMQDE